MDPQQLMAQGREMLVKELNLAHLTEEEQDQILDGLGEVLLRRVLLKMLELMPESERENFGKLFAAQDAEGMQAVVVKYIPNANDVIKAELRAGIDEHKRLVGEAVARDAASAPTP
ncbi:MAG: hypothetical protein G01um10148_1060 [Parcubacteria group bacterium Gr01-1014_8]|nr:MAG: hypothetical protein G01um10148_1060 [Parcubacteria group bacterium Gr01-1014_8]